MAGYVDREWEGSTGPSRGEHRLTVYRAHASSIFRRNELFVFLGPLNEENLAARITEFAERPRKPSLGQ